MVIVRKHVNEITIIQLEHLLYDDGKVMDSSVISCRELKGDEQYGENNLST